MAEEQENDDFDLIEGEEIITIKQYTQLQRPLAEITGATQDLVWAKNRGDMEFSCGIFNRHKEATTESDNPDNPDEPNTTKDPVAAYYETNGTADTPEKLEPDEDSIQGWTYIADYTVHPRTPISQDLMYYIHARINKNGEIEFAVFNNIVTSKVVNEKITLAEITGATQDLVW
jgi:hypothetical protein